jgi:tetratricopeptide (TPR) repeat protein
MTAHATTLKPRHRSLLRRLLAAGLIAAGCSTAVAESAQRPSSSARRLPDLPRLRQWLANVERHEPGAADDAATTVAVWPRDVVEGALLDLRGLVQTILQPRRPRLPSVTRFSDLDKVQLRRFAEEECARVLGRSEILEEILPADTQHVVNRLLKRGALLHTDIALLLPSNADRGGRGTPLLLPVREVFLVSDGRQAGAQYGSVHWDIARLLFDDLVPDASKDPIVRQWYHAVAAFMADKAMIAESGPHLVRARQLFPTDPDVLFASGALFESQNAPSIQNFILTAKAHGAVVDLPSERANQRRAEAYFRRAVELDASFAEARLRLGRAIGLLGRHQEAADQLRQVAEGHNSGTTPYYAWLFLGAEEQALGHVDRARDAFTQAAGYWPKAQSPYLALSQLARRAGDRPGAVRAIQQALALSSTEEDRLDPWWTYFEEPGRNASSLLADVRAALFLAER